MSNETEGKTGALLNPGQIRKDVAFSDNNLTGAMMEQASLYAHYGQLLAAAQRKMDGLENRLAISKATVANDLRNRHAARGLKITETAIQDAVLVDEGVQALMKEFANARMQFELARQTCEAFKQRRDMLVQVGKRQLEELEGQLRVSVSGSQHSPDDVRRLAALARGNATTPVK